MDKEKFHLTEKKTWFVTGAAGFIGSHLVEALLQQNQNVVGLDNLSSCGRKNLILIEKSSTSEQKSHFKFIEGDIRDQSVCLKACKGADYILHHAAIGSVPRSFEEATYVDSINVGGFLNVLKTAKECAVKKFIYASSSAVYGDYTELHNNEDQPLQPLSPYAVGKYANELYTRVLGSYYHIETVGLRYFNIYGPRQDPKNAYAAVIPKWIDAMCNGMAVEIYGDGTSVRDFCFIDDVVLANILAATTEQNTQSTIYNIASGQKTSLNALYDILKKYTGYSRKPIYKMPQVGDIKISYADITKARNGLSYSPQYDLDRGLQIMVNAYHDEWL